MRRHHMGLPGYMGLAKKRKELVNKNKIVHSRWKDMDCMARGRLVFHMGMDLAQDNKVQDSKALGIVVDKDKAHIELKNVSIVN